MNTWPRKRAEVRVVTSGKTVNNRTNEIRLDGHSRHAVGQLVMENGVQVGTPNGVVKTNGNAFSDLSR